MATPNLISQGVLVADKQYYNPNSHVNSANLFNMGMQGGNDMTDLGLVKTWAQIFRNVQPLYNFDSIAKQTLYTEGSKGVTWSTPIAMENPRIVEDLSESERPGQDGQEFKIAFDRPFSQTQSITYDHINNKYQLIITQEPYNDGDRWIHYVKIMGGDNKKAYISKEFLAPGTQWYQISAYRGDEYDNVAASFQTQVGERQWHYYLGQSEIAYNFEISKKALLLSKAGQTQEGNPLRVMELVKFQKDSEAFKYMLGEPSTNITKILTDVYKGDKKAMLGEATKSWLFEVEKTHMDKLMYDYVMNLMWGVGGRTRVETDTVSVSPGLYWQHRNYGNLVKYNLNQFSLDFLRNHIEQHFKHRMDFSAEGVILIKVGAGIYNIIEQEIKKEVAASGIIVAVEDSQRFLQGSRFELNFTMRYNAFFLKQFPQVKILMTHEPALDPVFANNISNPIVDGTHRLSSFTIILYDLNDIESDNIKLVKWKYDDKLRYMKEIGNIDWNDNNSTFIGNRGFSGIRGTMSMRHAGMLLIDPTKSLMFELNNPFK